MSYLKDFDHHGDEHGLDSNGIQFLQELGYSENDLSSFGYLPPPDFSISSTAPNTKGKEVASCFRVQLSNIPSPVDLDDEDDVLVQRPFRGRVPPAPATRHGGPFSMELARSKYGSFDNHSRGTEPSRVLLSPPLSASANSSPCSTVSGKLSKGSNQSSPLVEPHEFDYLVSSSVKLLEQLNGGLPEGAVEKKKCKKKRSKSKKKRESFDAQMTIALVPIPLALPPRHLISLQLSDGYIAKYKKASAKARAYGQKYQCTEELSIRIDHHEGVIVICSLSNAARRIMTKFLGEALRDLVNYGSPIMGPTELVSPPSTYHSPCTTPSIQSFETARSKPPTQFLGYDRAPKPFSHRNSLCFTNSQFLSPQQSALSSTSLSNSYEPSSSISSNSFTNESFSVRSSSPLLLCDPAHHIEALHHSNVLKIDSAPVVENRLDSIPTSTLPQCAPMSILPDLETGESFSFENLGFDLGTSLDDLDGSSSNDPALVTSPPASKPDPSPDPVTWNRLPAHPSKVSRFRPLSSLFGERSEFELNSSLKDELRYRNGNKNNPYSNGDADLNSDFGFDHESAPCRKSSLESKRWSHIKLHPQSLWRMSWDPLSSDGFDMISEDAHSSDLEPPKRCSSLLNGESSSSGASQISSQSSFMSYGLHTPKLHVPVTSKVGPRPHIKIATPRYSQMDRDKMYRDSSMEQYREISYMSPTLTESTIISPISPLSPIVRTRKSFASTILSKFKRRSRPLSYLNGIPGSHDNFKRNDNFVNP
jgi:hypothetical protein